MASSRAPSAHAFEHVLELMKRGRFDECAAAARQALEVPTLSVYIRMKLVTVLAGAIDDWEEAEGLQRDAEVL